jgi:hypothetical protein
MRVLLTSPEGVNSFLIRTLFWRRMQTAGYGSPSTNSIRNGEGLCATAIPSKFNRNPCES